MRVLLTEARPGTSTEVAEALRAAGHGVARCSDRSGAAGALPCEPLHGGSCPLEREDSIDAAVAVRAPGDATLGPGDWGAVCALRQGIPLVLVGAGDGDPLAGRATRQAAPGEAAAAVDDAVALGLAAHARSASSEVERLLASAGVTGASRVDVQRSGRDVRAVATLPPGTDPATRERIGVHLAGLLSRTGPRARRIDVSASLGNALDESR